ncbi:protein of unknown function (plasmid) [Caballeronia sp. S22]
MRLAVQASAVSNSTGGASIDRLEHEMKFCVPSVAPPGLVALSEKDIHTLRDFARGLRIYRTMLIDGSSKALRSLQNAMYLPSRSVIRSARIGNACAPPTQRWPMNRR